MCEDQLVVKGYPYLVLGGILLVIVSALLNRGGGPLASHLVLTVVTFVIALLAFFGREKLKQHPIDLLEKFLLGFLIFFLFSFITSLTKNFGINELLLYTNAVILIFILRRIQFTETNIEKFKTGLVFVALLESLAGMFIYIRFSYPRFGGTFIDLGAPFTSFANDFANFSILLLPICFERFFHALRAGEKVLYGLISAIVFGTFLLSFSRGGWISFAVAMIIWGIFLVIIHRKNSSFLKRAVILMLVTVGVISFLNFTRGQVYPVISFWGKATLSADEGGASIKERLDFWQGSLKLIAERPLLGSGILSFRYLYPKYQPDFGTNWDHPHNILLKMGVENGIIATFFFLGFLIVFAYRYIKTAYASPQKFSFTFPLMAGALGAFGHNLVDYNFIVSNFTLFAVFLGITASFLPQENLFSRFAHFFSKSSTPIISLCLVMSFTLISLGAHEGYYSYLFKKGRTALTGGNFIQAEEYFHKSKNLIFERDLPIFTVALYQKQNNIEAERAYLQQAAENTPYAAMLNRLGEIDLQIGAQEEAKKHFQKALSLDPKNRLRYYYNLFQTLPVEEKEQQKSAVLALLEEYETILRKNAHFTTLTDNPKYAVKLYEFFGDSASASRVRKIWLNETLKYVKKYGSLPSPQPL